MRFAIAASLAVLLAAALAAQASQKPAIPQPPAVPQQPTFKAGVNFVRVDVYPSVNGQIVPDLKRDEFEVLEDGVAQRIETFERVVIHAPGPESVRAEPRSLAEATEAAANPRNRLFVLFLDSYHTSVDSSTLTVGGSTGDFSPTTGKSSDGYAGVKTSKSDSRIGHALVTFLDRLIGPDDLIGLLRPEEPVTTLSFTRRPASFYDLLMNSVEWQRRFVRNDFDQREQMYRLCYGADSQFATQMIARRRERMVLGALRDLVVYLHNLREERKAILVITEGWQLFRPDPSLRRPRREGDVPGPPPIGVAGGQPALGDSRVGNIMPDCERDRVMLADLDDARDFRDMLNEANRANASFYPIDPRGLPVFDTPVGPDKLLAPAADLQALRGRLDSLQTLATATDGLAIVNSNDFAKNLRRISDDLSSYYLLGYNSTNTKYDGKFRKITVRVRRPGVDVRARSGYAAPTEADVKAADEANVLARDPADGGLQAALATLEFGRPNRVLLLRGAYTWPAKSAAHASGSDSASLAVVVELDATAARGPGWAEGGQLAATIVDPDGLALASGTATLSSTSRSCVIRFADSPLPPGDYFARVKAQWSVMTTTEQVRIVVPEASATAHVLGQPMLFRRGPYTGAGFQPTADLRFRRAERIRLDVPVAGPVDSIAGQLLDRKGQPLQVPVTPTRREDEGGAFITADVVLAPLAPGDYVIAVSVRRGDRTERALTAIRIVL